MNLLTQIERLEAEIERLREANRKMHRRAQIAEAFMQASEDIVNGWLDALKAKAFHPDRIILRAAIKDIARAKERARRALSSPEGTK